jgi:hypothetical protein
MSAPDLLWLSLGSVVGSFGAYGVAYGVHAIENLARRRRLLVRSQHRQNDPED